MDLREFKVGVLSSVQQAESELLINQLVEPGKPLLAAGMAVAPVAGRLHPQMASREEST
ncbi:MAG: hypothetical protein ABSD20_05880 [Terriglobales bacterium]|jgi:hypothetical protein